jgi:L-malate glycosyltransferase
MKIAYLYDAVYPWVKGGAEKRVYELSRRLAARGHDVHCYGMKWWDGPEVLHIDGVHIHGICRPVKLYSGERRSIYEAIYFASKVLSSLKGDYDLVDCQEFPYLHCFPAKLLSSLGRYELFITWHEVWGEYWREYLGRAGILGEAVERATSRLTDRNIAVSGRTCRSLEALGARGVSVVPNGIDFHGIERVYASDRTSDVIFAGRLICHKNVDLLIRALKLVKSEVPDIRAIIVGDGPEATNLKRLARDLGLCSNIEFMGFRQDYEEVISLMKSSGTFVLPSTREGFGIVALEAGACGLPVVTVNHSMNATCDLVGSGTGTICDLSDEGLASAVLDNLSRKGQMRGACVEQARDHDWERICDLVERVYGK